MFTPESPLPPFCEVSVALVTIVGLLSVQQHVSLHIARLCEGFVTLVTGVGLLTSVLQHVTLYVAFVRERLVAQLTHMGLLASVHHNVGLHMASLCE